MNDAFKRTISLIGLESFNKINESCMCIFGIGGVGSFVLEGLVRAGVGKIIVVDCADVDVTNLNRQIIATVHSIGLHKVDVAEKRAKEINPSVVIKKHNLFADENNISTLLEQESVDYIIDAIDSIPSKIAIIKYAKKNNINIISSMGTGNKLNPQLFLIDDINKTSVCPLARKVRKMLRDEGITKVDVLYSKEIPAKNNKQETVPASISFVPSVAGLLISGYVINNLIENVI